jgi:hypothetical protein
MRFSWVLRGLRFSSERIPREPVDHFVVVDSAVIGFPMEPAEAKRRAAGLALFAIASFAGDPEGVTALRSTDHGTASMDFPFDRKWDIQSLWVDQIGVWVVDTRSGEVLTKIWF